MSAVHKRRIILLTGDREVPHFKQFLLSRNPDLQIDVAQNLETLNSLVIDASCQVRLLAFLTDLIVPRYILSNLTITPYNIHPGPPEYPGSHPDNFAIWHRAKRYGVTAHEMTSLVDEGPIIAIDRFDMGPEITLSELDELTYARAVGLFSIVAEHCAHTDEKFPEIRLSWTGQKRTKAHYKALCAGPKGLKLADFNRIERACGKDLRVMVDTLV